MYCTIVSVITLWMFYGPLVFGEDVLPRRTAGIDRLNAALSHTSLADDRNTTWTMPDANDTHTNSSWSDAERDNYHKDTHQAKIPIFAVLLICLVGCLVVTVLFFVAMHMSLK